MFSAALPLLLLRRASTGTSMDGGKPQLQSPLRSRHPLSRERPRPTVGHQENRNRNAVAASARAWSIHRSMEAPRRRRAPRSEGGSGGIRSSELDVRRHHKPADQEQGCQSQRAAPTPKNNLKRPQVMGFWSDEDADDYEGNKPHGNQREPPPQTSPAIQRPRGRDQEPKNEREGSNHKHIRSH